MTADENESRSDGKKHGSKVIDIQQVDTQSHFIPKVKYIVRLNSRVRTQFDLVVMILATWNCFAIPFEIAFAPPIAEKLYWVLGNLLIDVFFLFDIILTFWTTYIDAETGDEVSDPKKIAVNYLKKKFWLDLLATIPFDLIFPTDGILQVLLLFGLLKVMRVTRLGRIINFLNAKEDMKMTLKIFKLVFFLVLYIHFAGCIFYFIIKDEKDAWIGQNDFMNLTEDIYESDGVWLKYWTCFYNAYLLLAGNGIAPKTTLQRIFCSFVLVAGAMINADIFGNMAVLMDEISQKATRF